MNSASYPIVRAFTSIATTILMGIALLFAPMPSQAADAVIGEVVGFQDATGKAVFLHDFKGKPVLINLWASWCAPCIKEMPSLAKLQQDYAAKGLVVVTISEDDTMGDALAFFKKAAITNLTPYFDKGHGVWTALQTRGLPTTVLVTREGKMVQRIEGPVDWQSPKVTAIVEEITGK
jgi:thiol-disulfide isomerase/thioredoxin